MKTKIHKLEISYIIVVLLWFIRMVLPGVKFVFIPSFVILTIMFSFQYNIYKQRNFIVEFLRVYNPLIILGSFYVIGIFISGKIYLNNIHDLLEFSIAILFLFFYFILLHKNKASNSFNLIFRKLLQFLGFSSLLIAIIGISNFYLQQNNIPFIENTPIGTSINENKNYYALFSFLGIISFIPIFNQEQRGIKRVLLQLIILILIFNIIFSYSFEAIFLLSLSFIILILFHIFSLLIENRYINLAKNTLLILIVALFISSTYIISKSNPQQLDNILFKHVVAYNKNINSLNTNAFDFKKIKYAFSYYQEQDLSNQIFGSGFSYFEHFGEEFHKNSHVNDSPNNPIISALLYSGFIGAVFTLLFLIISLYYATIYFKRHPAFSLILYTSLVFIFFSESTLFSVPIFLYIFSLAFLVRYREISDLKIDINLDKPGSMLLKETIDYFFATGMFIVFFPILFIVSILVLIFNGRPILFSQNRIGQNGKSFKLYKFRTMTNTKSDTSIAAKESQRISKFGHFLRKSKIDELPELWNIIRGDMSFVGPRPDVPGYADKLRGDNREILKLKPGLTGPASLKYINEEEILKTKSDPQKYNDEIIFPDKVKINRLYMKNWYFLLDMKIIFYTALRKTISEKDLQ